MPAVIFNGAKLKALKDELQLNTGNSSVISRIVDPTSVATDAVKGTLLLNPSTAVVYKKNDNGSSTNWSVFGSGSAGNENNPYVAANYSVVNSLVGSDLLIELKSAAGADPSGGDPCSFAFRNTSLALGNYTIIDYTVATNITVPDLATLGMFAEGGDIYLYAINNGGVGEVAVCGSLLDTRYLYDTTAISAAATDRNTLYSNTSETGLAIRFIGILRFSLAVPGVYDEVADVMALDNKDFQSKMMYRKAVTAGGSQGPASGNTDYIIDTNWFVTVGPAGFYILKCEVNTWLQDSQLNSSWTLLRGRFGLSSTPGSSLIGDPWGMGNFASNSSAFNTDFGMNSVHESEPIYLPANSTVYLNQRWSQQSGSAGTVAINHDGSANNPKILKAETFHGSLVNQ